MIPKNTNKQNRKKVIIFYASQNIYDWGSNFPPPLVPTLGLSIFFIIYD